MKMILFGWDNNIPALAVARYLNEYEKDTKFYIYTCVTRSVYDADEDEDTWEYDDTEKFKKVTLSEYEGMKDDIAYNLNNDYSDFVTINDLGNTYEATYYDFNYDYDNDEDGRISYKPKNIRYNANLIKVLEDLPKYCLHRLNIVNVPDGTVYRITDDEGCEFIEYRDKIEWLVAKDNEGVENEEL